MKSYPPTMRLSPLVVLVLSALASFNRLTRDYTGMLRYTTLLQQGIITPPVVSEQLQTVTGSRDKVTIGDRTRELKQHAGFELDKKRWKPTVNTRQ